MTNLERLQMETKNINLTTAEYDVLLAESNLTANHTYEPNRIIY